MDNNQNSDIYSNNVTEQLILHRKEDISNVSYAVTLLRWQVLSHKSQCISRVIDFHYVFHFGSIEGVHNSLPFGYGQLGLSLSKGGSNLLWGRKVAVLVEGIHSPAFSVLPNIIVRELTSCPKERLEE